MSRERYPQWRRTFDVALSPQEERALPTPPPPHAHIRGWAEQADGTLWAANEQGLWFRREAQWRCVAPGRTSYRDLQEADRSLVQEAGLVPGAEDGDIDEALLARLRAYTFPTGDVRGVAVDAADMVWVATSSGLVVGDGHGTWYTLGGLDGLPYADVRGVTTGADGSVWAWFRRGVARLHEGRWIVFAGPRWLPEETVWAVDVGADGSVEVWTETRTAHLYVEPMALSEKAAYYEAQIAARHARCGYVADCRLQTPGDLAGAARYASDNDGLWTAMYLAAESYRYAVTGEVAAHDCARQAAHALLSLETVTPLSGYPARAVVYEGEAVLRSDPERGEWHAFTTPAGQKGQWKGDTSSDEIVGHVYGLSIYHDLVADRGERAVVAEGLARIADHVIDHGYYLVDLDGRPTTWGVWASEKLNGDPNWVGDRGLNSLEVLALLRTAHHVSGAERFARAYQELATQHGYALNVLAQRPQLPGEVNHSDDELAFLSYYPLLRYEEEPALRGVYLRGLERAWQLERAEECPLWNFIYGALTGRPCDSEAAATALAEIPLDLIDYPVDATGRLDVVERPYRDRHGRPQAERPLRWLERPPMKWNGNPYALCGGSGLVEEAGTFYLLPYWMGRYYGFIAR